MKKVVKNAMAVDIRNVNMPIYTKTGDDGMTSLYGGKRILKSGLRVEAYGSVDELTSFIGLLITKIHDPADKRLFTNVQKNLYLVMSVLTETNNNIQPLEEMVKKFEQKIDFLEKKLPKLNRFLLPQGTETSCLFHITRTICRRSERNVVCFLKNHETMKQFNNVTIIKYLNRLSDLLFIMARKYNPKEILL